MSNMILTLCVFLATILQVTLGDAYLSLRFLTFRNPGGEGTNGHCCDGRFFICLSECDHSFTFCIDQIDGPARDISSCSYGRLTSGQISNEDNINFKDTVGKIRNPVILRLTSWPGQVRLKVYVVDVDDHNDDDVDYLIRDINMLPSGNPQGSRISLRNRVELTLEVRVYCGQFFFGLNCSVYCKAETERYDCDQQLGSKICHRGWMGNDCKINRDDCKGVICKNGGICVDLVNSFRCECAHGYVGRYCEEDVDECLISNNCLHGDCINMPGSYNCTCLTGYSGQTCDVDIDDCEQRPCYNGGTCMDQVGSFTCNCPAGFSGNECELDVDECTFDPCKNKATCINSVGTYQCDCLTGYHGNDCSLDINECTGLPCQNQGMCNNFPGGYNCTCEPGFEGLNCQNDIDECDISNITCENGATCHNIPGSYYCACTPGYDGRRCQDDVNECDGDPCSNGGTCQNLAGNFSCLCSPGYTGEVCDDNVDECLDNICRNGGTCQDLHGSFDCKCPKFWEGPTCEENVNECLSQPCLNSATCRDIDEGFICVCPREFLGNLCQQDTDECEQKICQNQATCVNSFGGYHCECPEGWMGQNCESDIDECARTVCNNLGTCVNTPGSVHCQCPINWQGPRCETDVDECETSPCRNNGTCHNMVGTFFCQCPPAWSGTLCDVDVDECAQMPELCSLPGNSSSQQLSASLDNTTGVGNVLCVNTQPGYLCTCAAGWSGQNCDEPDVVRSTSPRSQFDLSTPKSMERFSGEESTTDAQFSVSEITSYHQGERRNMTGGSSTNSSGELTIPFFLACRISPGIRWTVDRGLKQLLKDMPMFAGKTLAVEHKSEIGTSEAGETVTSIRPVVTVDSRILSDLEVSSVLNKVAYKFKNYMYCPLYTGAVSGKFSFSTQPLNSATPNWYPGLITACVLLFVVALAIIVIKCHRNKESRQKTYQLNSRPSVSSQAAFTGCPTTGSPRSGDSPPLGGDRKPLVKFKSVDHRSVVSVMNPLYATLDEMQEKDNEVMGAEIKTERSSGCIEEGTEERKTSVPLEEDEADGQPNNSSGRPEAVVPTTLEAEESRYSVPPNNSCAITGKLDVTVNQLCKDNATTIQPSSERSPVDDRLASPSNITERTDQTQMDRNQDSCHVQCSIKSPQSQYTCMHRPETRTCIIDSNITSSSNRVRKPDGSASQEETDGRYKNLPYIDDPAFTGRTRLQAQALAL